MANARKEKRLPFSDEEKQYVYEIIEEANSKGLIQKTVAEDLAEQLNASPTTIINVYRRARAEKKKSKLGEALEYASATNTPVINNPAFMGKKDLENQIAVDFESINEVDDELIEYVKEDVKTTHSIADAVEEFKKEIIAEHEATTPKAPAPPSQPKLVVEVDFNEIIATQTKVLLARIEELTDERNALKDKAKKLAEENQKLKDKFMAHILSN